MVKICCFKDDNPVIAIGVWVNFGSIDEPIGGIAHFLEHMVFKGAGKRDARQIALDLEDVGGYFNAYTDYEMTCYHARVLKDHWQLGLDILLDLVLAPWFPEEEFVKEKGVVIQEIIEAEDDPQDVGWNAWQEVAFGSHNLGQSILGKRKNIQNLTLIELKDCWQQNYHPSNLIIGLLGDVPTVAVQEFVDKKIMNNCLISTKQEVTADYFGGSREITRPEEQTLLFIGGEGFSYGHTLRPAARVLTNIWAGGMASRLFQNLREEHGLVYGVSAGNNPYRNNGLWYIHVNTSKANVIQVMDLIDQELNKNDWNPSELSRSVKQLEVSYKMVEENLADKLDNLIRKEFYQIKNDWLAEIKMVDYNAMVQAKDFMLRSLRSFVKVA